jgi:hypothetical protein
LAHGRSITRRHAWVRGTRSIAIRGISTGRILLTAASSVRPVDRHTRQAGIEPGAAGAIRRRLMPPDAVSADPPRSAPGERRISPFRVCMGVVQRRVTGEGGLARSGRMTAP